jgi:type IV pilus assembly protein PilQ
MVIDPSVKGSVDLKLINVPWDQAFEMVLKSARLGYVLDDTVVRVVPLSELAAEEAARKQLTDAQALAGEPEIRTFPLSYADAAKLANLLTKTVLSTRGQVMVDERTNMLIVSDLPGKLPAIEGLIRNLDRAQPQVEIEARIVEADRNSARALGIEWGMKGTNPRTGSAVPGVAIQNPSSITPGTQTGGTNSIIGAVDLKPVVGQSVIGLALGSIGGAFNLDVALTALEKSGKGRILSTPSVTTQNNREAEVTQGFQIPIQTVSNNTTTVTFKDAALKLLVTPQITTENSVMLHVTLENGFPDFTRAVNGNPSIRTQRAVTQVQVGDGVTTVIGGILSSTETSNLESTPGLSSIPLLGWLFKKNTTSLDAEELLIFITPRILKVTP